MSSPAPSQVIDEATKEIVYRDYVDISVAVSTPKVRPPSGWSTDLTPSNAPGTVFPWVQNVSVFCARSSHGSLALSRDSWCQWSATWRPWTLLTSRKPLMPWEKRWKHKIFSYLRCYYTFYRNHTRFKNDVACVQCSATIGSPLTTCMAFVYK